MNAENENPAVDDPTVDDPAKQKDAEKERLKASLRDIREHMKQIDEIIASVEDLLGDSGTSPDAPASREEIIDLLKKYSRL